MDNGMDIIGQSQRLGALIFDAAGRKVFISDRDQNTTDIKFFETKGKPTRIPGQEYYDIHDFMNSLKREGKFIKLRKLYNNPTILFK